MKTIAQHWEDFALAVLPHDVSEIQRTEMRRAFYAGFYGALMACYEIAADSEESDDVGVDMLQQLVDESMLFAADIQAGRA